MVRARPGRDDDDGDRLDARRMHHRARGETALALHSWRLQDEAEGPNPSGIIGIRVLTVIKRDFTYAPTYISPAAEQQILSPVGEKSQDPDAVPLDHRVHRGVPMRPMLTKLSIILLSIVTTAAVVSAQGSVAGKVTQQDNGAGVSRVHVQATMDGKVQGSAVTADDGTYRD